MTIWRKHLQFINVMLANRSSTIVPERGSGRMTYATKKNPFAEHDLHVTLQRAGNKAISPRINNLTKNNNNISFFLITKPLN